MSMYNTIKSAIKTTDSRNILSKRRISDNATVVEVIQKSLAQYVQRSGAVRLCSKISLSQLVVFQ